MEGTPSPDREHLERITIRPTNMPVFLSDVLGDRFIAEQFYTPYTLRLKNGMRKFRLFSGAMRNVGDRFVAVHVDGGEHGGWRGDWIVVDSHLATSKVWEWVVVS
jgi:hypothetical protein